MAYELPLCCLIISHAMAKNSRTRSLVSKLALITTAAAVCAYTVRERRRISFKSKVVLISGASRGLGLELARGFAAEGAKLALLARDPEKLTEAASELMRRGVDVCALQCDVRNPEEVQRCVESIYAQWGRIDVLINNAGIIQVGPSEQMRTEDYVDAMAIHFWAPLYLMQEVIPHMKRQGHGRIVNIASIGGKIAVPHLLPYVASKFALVGLSEGMRAELAKNGILVTTVSPGLMRTGSHFNALFKGQNRKEFALFSMANAIPLFSISSDRAARQIIEACRYGTAEIVITPQARIALVVKNLFPRFVAETLSLLNRALPGPNYAGGEVLKSGWQSQSIITPSFLTRLADRAAKRNLEEPRNGAR